MRVKLDIKNSTITYTYKGVSFILPLNAPKEKFVKVLSFALTM